MASVCGRLAISTVRRTVLPQSVRCLCTKITMGDPLEHATGLEKRELLQKLAGNTDVWHLESVKRGPGTREQPNEIPSAFDARIVGCLCDSDASCFNYMWLHKGEPKRCQCGYWFKLVHKDPV